MSNPPGLSRQPPRGRHGGLLTPRCRCRDHSPNVRAICAPFAHALSRAYTLQITRGSHCTFICESTRAASAITSSASSCARSRQGSSLRSDPLCGPAGLDDTCAQLEGSTYVMAEEARRIFPYVAFFRIDQRSQQTYGEGLVGAITHPLRSRIRRGALQPSLSELRCSPFNK